MTTYKYLAIIISVCMWGSFSVTFGQTSCLEGSEKIIQTYLGKISGPGGAHEKSLVNLLINSQETKDQRKGLIYHFCDTLLGTRPDKNNMENECFIYDTFTYDPRQSLFMYGLCVNTEEKNTDLKTFPKRNRKEKFRVGYFEISEYMEDNLDINELRGIPLQDKLDAKTAIDDCNPAFSMQGCDFSYFMPHLFKEIMNAYTNMKLATIYGYKYILKDESEEAKKQHIADAIYEFSTSYFAPPPSPKQSPSDNECGTPGLTYISKETNEGDKKHCTHPQTYTQVEETILSSVQIIEKVDWLKADKIIANACENASENLMSCAFSSKGDYFADADWKDFQNLYLNELMFFTLFSNYYANQILDNITYNPISIGSVSFSAERGQKEYKALQNELQLHTKATYQSMRSLSQIYTSYPLHIAMMAYLEDLLQYRKAYVQLYPSLHQLNFTLRNVQACES